MVKVVRWFRSCSFCLNSTKKCKCLSWWLLLLLLLSCMPSFFFYSEMFVGVFCTFLSSSAAWFLRRFSSFFPPRTAAVHLGLPQTQHALNFASYHNAAVKLITSLECKNETPAHTQLQQQQSQHRRKHPEDTQKNTQENTQENTQKTHRKNTKQHPHAGAITQILPSSFL